ncbi:hypothetical protein MS3_00000579 [Schistosoma haematobium]|uniref:Reverse transcriptase domain-containing protein n=1 Tax=Schistosoma haematobium TaxID=6185 RepID=A0A922IK21_SCHHA|nr:hypothetical protein MS3_00000579 [Schistosoma haematobium]KAH9581225.1 hypothetical protein MS3_00000579 [Schistosoma haematobium]
MISFDVTMLFTSVQPSLVKQTPFLLLTNDANLAKYTKLQSQSLLELIDLCLTTHFQFNNQIYEQTKGTPMGSPISGLIAEAVVQRLEASILPVGSLCGRHIRHRQKGLTGKHLQADQQRLR